MKKLFTYLLISSMVVLSSCTNYDDQFDDLNSQLSTLKTQIDGFTALSSGVAALQGTVTSLQAAVAALPKTATPATDISGLQTALTALAATVAELKTSLDGAATSADVLALQTALAAQQANLNELLAANNVYSANVTVASQADLDFATALGNKVSIINGNLSITQTAIMDATQLATLMGKVLSVTGDVAYTATISSVTTSSFTKLTGSRMLTIAQTGDISLPVYVQATGAFSVTGDDLTTSVSLPMLKATTTMAFAGIDKATSFSMPALAVHDGAISILIANAGSVDLSALTNSTTEAGAEATSPDNLTINAVTLTAPLYDAGTITADRLTDVNLPKWKYTNASSFDRALTVVLPSVNNAKAASYSINIATTFPKATSVHLIAAASTATIPTHLDVTTGASDNLNTLILGGTWDDVTVNGTDLTSLTFDGTAMNVEVSSTDITALDIPYTSAAKGTLTINANLDLVTVIASKVNTLKGLTITGNTELNKVTFAALAAAETAATVNITGNKFAGVVTYTNTGATTGTLASTSGLKELKGFLNSAITGRTGSVAMKVELDDATEISSTGTETTPSATYFLIDLIAGTVTGANDAVAYKRAFDLSTTGAGNIQIMVGSDALYVNSSGAATPITPSANMALAVSELKTAASRAAALGLTMDVVSGGNVQGINVVFATSTDSSTNENTYATNSTTTLLGTDDFATLTIGSQSVTSTYVTGYSGTATATAGIASGLAAAWAAKYNTASTLYTVNGNSTSGTIAVTVSNAIGNRADGDLVQVSFGAGAATSTTPVLAWKIGATKLSSDNKLLGDRVIVTLANATAGISGVASPTVTYNGTLTVSGTLTSLDDHSAAKALGYLGNVWPTEARGLAVNARESAAGTTGVTALTVNRTSFL
jgi:hypothetical protein